MIPDTPSALTEWSPAPLPKAERAVMAFDIKGFTKFAQSCRAEGGDGAAERVGEAVSQVFTALIEALATEGFSPLDIQGDCLFFAADDVALQPASAALETALWAAARNGGALRVRGAVAIAQVARHVHHDPSGRLHFWAQGPAMALLHHQMQSAPKEQPPAPPAPQQAPSLLSGRTNAGFASIAAAIVLCVRICDVDTAAKMPVDDARGLIDRIGLLCRAYGVVLQKITQDDKGLLAQIVLPDGGPPTHRQAVELARDIRGALGAQWPDLRVGLDLGAVYRGPVVLGAQVYATVHGTPANGAAKLANAPLGGLSPCEALLPLVEAAPVATPQSLYAPFVGREDEQAWLEDRLWAGHSVGVSGPSGIGKTRLARQVFERTSPQGAGCVVSCRPSDMGTPYAVVTALLQSCAGFRENNGVDAGAVAALCPTDLDQGVWAEACARLLGQQLPADLAAFQAIKGTARRELMDRAALSLLSAFVTQAGHSVFVDDAQWFDASSRRVFMTGARQNSLPVMLMTLRTDVGSSGWLHDLLGEAHIFDLEPLPLPDFCTILRADSAALGAVDGLSDGVLSDLYAVSDGAPALALQAVLSGALVNGGGIGAEDLPKMLSARFERLGAASHYLVQFLSLLEIPLSVSECLRLVALRGLDLGPRGIDHLMQQRLLAPALDRPDRLEISHTMIAQAIRKRTTPNAKTYLHERAARFLEGVLSAGETARTSMGMVAAHWGDAGRAGRAIVWHLAEAKRAERLGAYHGVLASVEPAVDLLSSRPGLARRLSNTQMMAARAYWGLGEITPADRACGGAIAAALDGGQAPKAAAPMRGLRLRESLAMRLGFRKDMELLENISFANSIAGEIAYFRADTNAILRSNANALILPRFAGHQTGSRTRGLAFFAVMLGMMRAKRLSRRMFHKARKLAGDKVLEQAQIDISQATLWLMQGRWNSASSMIEHALTVAREKSDLQLLRIGVTLEALNAHLRGDFAAAQDGFERLEVQARKEQSQPFLGWAYYGQAQALLEAGDFDAANTRLSAAEEIVLGGADRQSEVICRGLRIRLDYEQHRFLEARDGALAQVAYLDGIAPNNFSSLDGFAAAPEILARRQLEGAVLSEAEAQALKAGLKQLKSFQKLFPVARPRYCFVMALEARSRGVEAEALIWGARGIKVASRLGMQAEIARLRNLISPVTQSDQNSHLTKESNTP